MAANLDMTLPDGEDAAAGTDIKGGLKHVSMTVDNVCNSSIYRRYDMRHVIFIVRLTL